ncbi:MAG: hypothetical protein CJBNEKGG_04152 [Prosthecobacter sp.]|nr:hypothetical protein [Prosthecobacter sp.]
MVARFPPLAIHDSTAQKYAAKKHGPMTSKSSRFRRLIAEMLPVVYGGVMACVAAVLFLGVVILNSRETAFANPLEVIQTVMMNLPQAELPGDVIKERGTKSPERRLTPPRTAAVEDLEVKPAVVVPGKPSAREASPKSVRTNPPPIRWVPLRDDVTEYFRTHIPDIGGTPLLHYAVMLDDGEWIGRLVAHGADANELTAAGDTLLCSAVRLGAAGSVAALTYAGADVHKPGLEKQPPLPLASLRRGPEIYRSLLAAGADANGRFATPVTRELLDRVTIKDLRNALESDRGVTPLIACASRGDVEGAAVLLRHGASPSKCTTRYHRYPINFAATQGYLFLMRIILGRQPESEPEVLVTVDLSSQRAWLTRDGRVVDSCPVSTGREGFNTPAGRYVITDKHRSWTSTLYHVAMPFFMRLNCSAIGLHSGYVTGRPASHGCIRLPYDKARSFFSICSVGDEVQIIH